eukprot:113312_1
MSYVAHLSFASLLCILTSSTIAIDIVLDCESRFGDASPFASIITGNPSVSTVSCNIGETMVSCGIEGSDNIGGTTISGSPSVCTSYNYSPTRSLRAVARCCIVPSSALVTTSQVTSATGESVSAACAAGTTLTGCVALYSSGVANNIQGAYSGVQGSPPQTSAWISTGNKCNAAASAGTTVQAVANCLSIGGASYSMNCETKATDAIGNGFGGCQVDYYMMSCAGFLNIGSPGMDQYYVTATDTCYVFRDNSRTQYANAICCQMTGPANPTNNPTSAPSPAPTDDPTNNPTIAPSPAPSPAPTNNPTHKPTIAPSPAPTDNPTNNPTIAPSPAPTDNPTKHPTIAPSHAPSLAPTFAPTQHPTRNPTFTPTFSPTLNPTVAPTDSTENPTLAPTAHPTDTTYSPSNAPTIAPTFSPTMSPTLSWQMCLNEVECAYIAKITYRITFNAADTFGGYLSTLSGMATLTAIVKDIMEAELIEYISIYNMLIRGSLGQITNAQIETSILLTAHVATDDEAKMRTLFDQVESESMSNRITPVIAEHVNEEEPDSVFVIDEVDGKIELIKPENWDADDQDDDSTEDEQLTWTNWMNHGYAIPAAGAILLLIVLLCCFCCFCKKGDSGDNDEEERESMKPPPKPVWVPPSFQSHPKESIQVQDYSDSEDNAVRMVQRYEERAGDGHVEMGIRDLDI